ncbi:hypothetical protein L226DRAFT_532515 [Lentinus tigrinus ALCF2SS1-7]|uniref:Glutathione S-transferase UstS-like C-terminal domain-containing protein n=1 Tax=Lentinus tigrinus ALCF2SS1-6 TaxID=1328759 RepID=A0A5C2SLY5_9APHY|nr:hypothetical protein L227DRAFT_562338 [Lentinus tigrinus ALCF2SS1-6]RPD77738.1 hypothetical protein L226DRAFT_532515 [Lentinus tigrinus ALCF2SS1-7]
MPEPIIFYDIPGVGKAKAWSPNTWKVRYTLNFKGLPYKTVWVEYPDIEALCKKIGASAVEKRADGSPLARYLDKTYPDTPQVIPEEADTLIAAFGDAIYAASSFAFVPIIIPAAFSILRPASQPYFRKTREVRLGGKLEELAPAGSEKRAASWQGTQKGVHKMAGWFEAAGKEKLFVMGDKKGITYADIMLASWFVWFKKCCGEESQEWKDMMSWDGGRWARFVAAFEKYEVVDEGEDVVL